MKKQLIFFSLAGLALGERLVFDLGPNVELVTTAMLVAGFYLGRQWGWRLIFPVMLVSDAVLGNTNIFLFTWTGFIIPAWIAGRKSRPERGIFFKTVLAGTAAGIMANLFFYVWTNFGVWLSDSFGMYERNLTGLWRCYLNGLPFLRQQLASTLAFTTLGFSLAELVREWENKNPVRFFGRPGERKNYRRA